MTFTLDQNWDFDGSASPATTATATGTATASGALLIAVASSAGAVSYTFTDSAGTNTWQQACIDSSSGHTLAIWYALDADPVTSVTATASASTTRNHLGVASYTSTGTVSLADADAVYRSTVGATWDALALTPLAIGDLVLSAIEIRTSSRQTTVASPFTRDMLLRQSQMTATATATTTSTADLGATWTLSAGTNADATLAGAVFTEYVTPTGLDLTGNVIDNLAWVSVTSSTGTEPFTWEIEQMSGATTAPVSTGDGTWTVAKHASDTLIYDVTVTDDDGLSSVETVSVPPIPSSGSGSGPLRPTGTLPSTTWV